MGDEMLSAGDDRSLGPLTGLASALGVVPRDTQRGPDVAGHGPQYAQVMGNRASDRSVVRGLATLTTPTARRRAALARLGSLAAPDALRLLGDVLRLAVTGVADGREAALWLGLAMVEGRRQRAPWLLALVDAAAAGTDAIAAAWIVSAPAAAAIEHGLAARGRLPDVSAIPPSVWRRRWGVGQRRFRANQAANVASWKNAGSPPDEEPGAALAWFDAQSERRFTQRLTWAREVGRPEHTASPDVVRSLLAEREVPWPIVVRVAARRPTHADLVDVLVASDAAMARPDVRAALIDNPSVTTGVRLALLPGSGRVVWRALAARPPHLVQVFASHCVLSQREPAVAADTLGPDRQR